MTRSARFAEALQFLHAAIAVAVYGSVAAGESLPVLPLQRIMPLEEEFADVFSIRRPIIRRISTVMRWDPSRGPFGIDDLEERGILLLRKTDILPSQVVRATANKLNQSSEPPRISLRLKSCQGIASAVARELNCDERFVRWCWKHDRADLDKQWELLRGELQKIRAEIAEGLL
jgi:hypothetical protein